MQTPTMKPLARQARGRLLHFTTIIVALVILASQVGSVTAAADRRIRLKHGQTTGSVKGRLKNIHDQAFFVLWARKGQHMRVNIQGEGPTRGEVIAPSGQGIGGSPGGVVFDEDLPETGDYRIRVTESMMAEEWKGSFVLTVTIN
jgi:hypothetical protein